MKALRVLVRALLLIFALLGMGFVFVSVFYDMVLSTADLTVVTRGGLNSAVGDKVVVKRHELWEEGKELEIVVDKSGEASFRGIRVGEYAIFIDRQGWRCHIAETRVKRSTLEGTTANRLELKQVRCPDLKPITK